MSEEIKGGFQIQVQQPRKFVHHELFTVRYDQRDIDNQITWLINNDKSDFNFCGYSEFKSFITMSPNLKQIKSLTQRFKGRSSKI